MYLETIQSPKDLKKIPLSELNVLCWEIRQRILEVVSRNGGHLASSLGAVELIAALHYCLNAPEDKILFDVGHQCYAHKILTGRNKDFQTLRQYGGISGFPTYTESEYDTFTSGHSSDAVSLSLGLSAATNRKAVCVIGDGSLSGGLCFEGLNNAGHLKKDILVILNTNEMSISPAVGAISVYINKIISQPLYNRFISSLEQFIRARMPKGRVILKLVKKFEKELKGFFVPGMLFEELGFRYFGPLDGHNLELLIPTLKNILNYKGPIILHVFTKKGKGFPPAEREPEKFHSVGCFDIVTGEARGYEGLSSYTDIFRRKMIELAQDNGKVIAITAAMPEGTGLDAFARAFPGRFYDVGISEGHAACFAAGFAKSGFKPVVAIYSTFLQRAYDQLLENIALQNLPVVFCLDRAGISGPDGLTHQGIFDLCFLRHMPNFVVMAPSSGREFELMLDFALSLNVPCAIRYPKAKIADDIVHLNSSLVKIGKSVIMKEGKDAAIIAIGSMVKNALGACPILEKENISCCLVNARFARPLDRELLLDISSKYRYIITIEEGVLDGGFGSGVLELLNRPLLRLGLPDEFVVHGSRELLLAKYGLDAEGIARSVRQFYKG